MAEVFRAATIGSAGFNKMVAIKRILPHLARDPDFGVMFIDEAKIASMLNHPNVLQVLDLGAQKGQHFIAMEYVAGRPLNKLLAHAVRRGLKLPQPMCCEVVLRALRRLSGLDYEEFEDLVHSIAESADHWDDRVAAL